ncbi:MAG: cation:proton antiporter [Betaproteobacteria bacterium]|nr:cation:proton antiporter [Betaproteobacteria bacterium]
MRNAPSRFCIALAFAFTALFPGIALAADGGVVGENLLWLAIILMSARLFSPLAARLGFPAVLGELLLGVALGNLSLFGVKFFDTIAKDPIIAFMAELGAIVLMLQIGLETRLADLVKVGGRAASVGVAGVATPFALGAYLAGPWLLPGLGTNTYLFLGAALASTSVGITGRVFRDLNQIGTAEARIVLGAAVIDHVLGLVILAVVSGLVRAGSVTLGEVGSIIVNAALFLVGSIVIGRALAPYSSRWLARLDRSRSMLFAQVLATGLFMAWLAHLAGLAPIIGAFAAGLLFEPVFLKTFETPKIVREVEALLPSGIPSGTHSLVGRVRETLAHHAGRQHEHMLEPIGYFFVPVFFVLTGMQVDLSVLASCVVVAVALGVAAAAVAGKLLAGFVAGRGVNAWVVGWGMVPRGEVGLIFAMAGKQLGVVNEALFSVIVIMVILSTIIAPPVLTLLLRKKPSTGNDAAAQ